MSFLFILLGIIIARFFWRQLITAVAWVCALLACYLVLRYAPSLGLSSAWLSTFYSAALLGLIVGVLLSWRIVVNWLVNADRAREHERVDTNADKRLV